MWRVGRIIPLARTSAPARRQSALRSRCPPPPRRRTGCAGRGAGPTLRRAVLTAGQPAQCRRCPGGEGDGEGGGGGAAWCVGGWVMHGDAVVPIRENLGAGRLEAAAAESSSSGSVHAAAQLRPTRPRAYPPVCCLRTSNTHTHQIHPPSPHIPGCRR